MEFIVRGNHVDITPELRSYSEEKIGRLSRFSPEIIQIEVELRHDQSGREGNAYCAEAQISLPGPDIIAKERAGSLPEAIDLLEGKLKVQLLRAKERELDRRRKK